MWVLKKKVRDTTKWGDFTKVQKTDGFYYEGKEWKEKVVKKGEHTRRVESDDDTIMEQGQHKKYYE